VRHEVIRQTLPLLEEEDGRDLYYLPDLPEARIVVYTPRDDDTRAKMPLTRRDPATAQIPS